MTATPALFDAFPALARALPHHPIGEFPTAIERVPAALFQVASASASASASAEAALSPSGWAALSPSASGSGALSPSASGSAALSASASGSRALSASASRSGAPSASASGSAALSASAATSLGPGGVELWVKRDDRASSLYGGNKVRKLEFLLADAAARGRPRLVTVGGWGSHHVLATALHARAARGRTAPPCDFTVDAVLFPQPLTEAVRDHLLADVAAGARIVPARSYATLPFHIARLRARGGVSWIAAGGSSPVGTLGWVSAGLEIAAQSASGEAPAFDVIYAALGSCGTVAGLWLGLGLAGWRGRLVAVRVVDRVVSNARAVRRLARATHRLLQRSGLPAGTPLALPPLTVEDGFFGDAYGAATPAARDAIARLAALPPPAALRLEGTYTGKAAAALLAHTASGALDGQRVLFVHTFSSADLAPHLPAPADRAAAVAALPPSLRQLFPEAVDARPRLPGGDSIDGGPGAI